MKRNFRGGIYGDIFEMKFRNGRRRKESVEVTLDFRGTSEPESMAVAGKRIENGEKEGKKLGILEKGESNSGPRLM